MSSYENSSLTEIEAVLDGLDEATAEQVFDATRPYSPRAIASVAASRADAAGGDGGGVFSQVSVTLTNAQIKALPSSPVEVVPAPGAGNLLVPVSATLHVRGWVADYTNIAADASITVAWGSTPALAHLRNDVVSGVSGLLAGGDPEGTWAILAPIATVPAAAGNVSLVGVSSMYDSDIGNRALVLRAQNSGGDFTGGDAAMTLKVDLVYRTVTF